MSIGGGHEFSTTLGRLRNGIELDLSNFDTVSVDVQSSTITIGGAVRFRDILGPLGQAHKKLRMFSLCQKSLEHAIGKKAIGSESCVGMVGATLGGGVGRYNGLHGLLLDSLSSVKMAAAAGDLVTASTKDLQRRTRISSGAFAVLVSILELSLKQPILSITKWLPRC